MRTLIRIMPVQLIVAIREWQAWTCLQQDMGRLLVLKEELGVIEKQMLRSDPVVLVCALLVLLGEWPAEGIEESIRRFKLIDPSEESLVLGNILALQRHFNEIATTSLTERSSDQELVAFVRRHVPRMIYLIQGTDELIPPSYR